MSYTRLYKTWSDMKTRCSNRKSPVYRYYGGRGITVCKEWAESFVAFREWAESSGYGEGLEIDRRDPNGNYEPANCRWATRCQQMRNTKKRSNAKTSKFRGVSKHSQNTSWVAQGHCDRRPVYIGSFKTEIEAAKAYDEWAGEHYREYASLNFKAETQGGVLR